MVRGSEMAAGPLAGSTSPPPGVTDQHASPSGISNLDSRIRELENKENV
ncbi:MAG: hypothetical protein M0Z77_11560 [Thermoplasmatales archaeon]|nr:hypothetical protein [Candidatus Thermoplasmatota archaeon]MDA8056265.1 hypothetical protein [Thermoplasmatales archaeon]